MSSKFPFPHDLHVYVVADDHSEVAYYARDKKKYRRERKIGMQTWQDTIEQQIDSDLFYFIVACLERRKRRTHGLVGMG